MHSEKAICPKLLHVISQIFFSVSKSALVCFDNHIQIYYTYIPVNPYYFFKKHHDRFSLVYMYINTINYKADNQQSVRYRVFNCQTHYKSIIQLLIFKEEKLVSYKYLALTKNQN